MTPRTSVIMPVFNGERHLAEAVESILHQSCAELELITVDDGSTDGTNAILEGYREIDARVVVLRPGKVGFGAALNLGIDAARGEFIARMDGDDIALPGRLAKQIEFLDARPEISVCGTAIEVFSDGPGQHMPFPGTAEEIRAQLLFHSPLCHPAVVMRKADLQRHHLTYRGAYGGVADYDLWCQIDRCGLRMINLPDVLVRYRRHALQLSTADRPAQQAVADRVRREHLAHYGIQATARELELHSRLGRWEPFPDREQLSEAGAWLERLGKEMQKCATFPQAALQTLLADHWYHACATASCSNWDIVRTFWHGFFGKNNLLRAIRLAGRRLR
jgi:glycosyltransferase involved in cell wall biosynthesis